MRLLSTTSLVCWINWPLTEFQAQKSPVFRCFQVSGVRNLGCNCLSFVLFALKNILLTVYNWLMANVSRLGKLWKYRKVNGFGSPTNSHKHTLSQSVPKIVILIFHLVKFLGMTAMLLILLSTRKWHGIAVSMLACGPEDPG